MIIVDKQQDPTPPDAPPSYDTVHPHSAQFHLRDHKPLPDPISVPSTSSSTPPSPSPIVKSPSSSKLRASNTSWFNFSASRTTREVHTTVLGLIRDLVKEQHTNSRASLGILESCTDACSRYDLSLPTLLQEPAIEGHTPLYWAIVKRPPDGDSSSSSSSSIPDLLTALISYASPLTPQTIADIRHACLLTSDQLLFQRLRMSPEFSPLSGTDEMLLGARIPPDEIRVENVAEGAEGAFVVELEVVCFQKRMLVSKRIELDFIARARMWRLAFSIVEVSQRHGPRQGSWCISLSLLEHSPPTWIDSRLIILEPPPLPSSSSSPPPPPTSPSLMDRVKSQRPKPKPKPAIDIRLKSRQQLVAPPSQSPRKHPAAAAIVVSLEDSTTSGASSLQYAGTSYIAPDETLRARLEARLGRSAATADSECTIC